MTADDLKPFYAHWAAWFAQPIEAKLQHKRNRAAGTGYYFPAGSEAPGYGAADTHKEYVHVKWADVQPGAWARAAWPVWRDAFDSACAWLNERGLGDVYEALRKEDQVLRVLHYLSHPTGEVGHAHRDFNLLTVNIPGTVPGLEKSLYPDASWLNGGERRWVPDDGPGIHVGEMLEIYTGPAGASPRPPSNYELPDCGFQATRHRVRTPPNTDRLKAVFFVVPPNDFVLRPRREYNDPVAGRGGRRPAFTVGDYLRGVLNKASPGAGVQR